MFKALAPLLLILFSSHALANPEGVVKRLGIHLEPKGKPTANFVYAVKTGNLLYTSGHVPKDGKGNYVVGKVGRDLNLQQGQKAAYWAGVSLLATLKQELGDLRRVKRIVKVLGMVNATEDFKQHSQVLNGFSDLMVQVFGEERGKHARSAVGMASLPINAAVEIEMIVELEE